MSLVGKKAPLFSAGAVINGEEIVENFSLEQFIGKKDVVFFFYPKDFTFVCPTEILAFQEKLAEFEKRGVAVIGASTDTEETHLAWLMTPKSNGGIEGVTYPLVADVAKTIAHNYGVLAGEWNYNEEGQLTFEGAPIAYRGTFLIDKQGIVRHETINDFPLGRNIDEMIRLVDALHHVEKYGEVCPANWEEGKEAMTASREGVANYLSNN
ncbi:peroxiredoxin [Cecembia calidifontis]|jgi:peroxiredoxin (alkyl hydroperoxide reductase subunit C)|uniref:Thioredoxin peroxidase n=1 Tax=Cecembia calidifontis TaxID=1187080 RepID=A0A4Q7P4E7_9BACT|nr:peroxiredoxin [Cecembia calidifontis]RZS94853.1 peroxiredoxin (alkyl hydroperoxide reductase subunit C) [Cecembia calidifontis]